MYVHVIVFFSLITVQLDTEKQYYLKVSTKSLTVIPPPIFMPAIHMHKILHIFLTIVQQFTNPIFCTSCAIFSIILKSWKFEAKKSTPSPLSPLFFCTFGGFFLFSWRICILRLYTFYIFSIGNIPILWIV